MYMCIRVYVYILIYDKECISFIPGQACQRTHDSKHSRHVKTSITGNTAPTHHRVLSRIVRFV